jgi:hypothetical protein
MSTAIWSDSSTNPAAAQAPAAVRQPAGMAVAVQLGLKLHNRRRLECN